MPSFASGTQYCVPVTLSNTQSTATSAGLQVMVTVDSSSYSTYLASNLQNVNFQDGSGNILSSWLESGETNSSTSSIYWVVIPTSIPASTGTLTIYYCLYSTTTNCMNTTTTGAEPNYTTTYAQYDNGASVFNFYDNFKGTTLNTTKWDIASGASATVDNGVTVSLASGDNWYGIYTASFTTTQSIAETYAKDNGGTNSGFDIATDGVAYQENSGAPTPEWVFGTGGTVSSSPTANGASSTTDAPAANTFYLFGAVINSGSPLIQVAYNTLVTGTYSITTPTAIGLGTSASNSAFFQWFRTRTYPPNGVMPTVSFGSIENLQIVFLYAEHESYSITFDEGFIIKYAETSTDNIISPSIITYSETSTYSITPSVTYNVLYAEHESYSITFDEGFIIKYAETSNETYSQNHKFIYTYSENDYFMIFGGQQKGTTGLNGLFEPIWFAMVSFDASSGSYSALKAISATYLPPNTNVSSVSATGSITISTSFTFSSSSSYSSPTLTTTIIDSASTAVPNATVSWSSSSGSVTVSPTSALTNSSGEASTTISGTGATITASTTLLGITKTSTASV